MAEILEMNPKASGSIDLMKQMVDAIKENTKALQENTEALNAEHNHLMHQDRTIADYFDGVSYNTAIHAMDSKDFPKVFLSQHKKAKPMYPSKGVEQWIHEHTVYGY